MSASTPRSTTNFTMEELIEKYNLTVKKIHGKNEYEMYSNYINDVDENTIKECLNEILAHSQEKDDSKAETYISQARLIISCLPNNYKRCYFLCTQGLRYAVYNGEEYAWALCHRAAANMLIHNHQTAIADLELCLKANCSDQCRFKALNLRSYCFKRLSNCGERRTAIKDLLGALKNVPNSAAVTEGTSSVIAKKCDDLHNRDNKHAQDTEVPVIHESHSFANASNAVTFKYDKWRGYQVLANRHIKTGDILFVEEAFASAPCKNIEVLCPEGGKELPLKPNCYYCMRESSDNCVPCKTCIVNMYCDGHCRDLAWNKFHQWECAGNRSNLLALSNHGHLAFRIICKAVRSGVSVLDLDFKGGVNKYGNKENNYPFVYNLPTNLDKLDKEWLTIHCATAAIYVQYLKDKTDFFDYVKKLPGHSEKSEIELFNGIGGLFIRHCAQLHCCVTPYRMITDPITTAGRIEEVSQVLLAGMTVCPSIALMNHSCVPNTAHYFVGDTAVVKAISDIQPGEELFRSYISVFFQRTHWKFQFGKIEDKRAALKKYCFINCECEFCTNPWRKDRILDSYICCKCEGPAAKIGIHARVQCADCKYKFSVPEESIKKEEMARSSLAKFLNSDKSNAEQLYDALENCEGILVPHHNLFITIYDELCRYHKMKDNAKDFFIFARKRLQLLRRRDIKIVECATLNYGLCWITVSIMKRKRIGNDSAFQEVLEGVKEALKEAEKIFELCYPTYQRNIDDLRRTVDEICALKQT